MTVFVTPEAADAIVKALGFHYRDPGLMYGALGAPMPVFGYDPFPSIHEKAAALIIAINRNHPIMEGNKRTSWVITTFFYAENGFNLAGPTDDVVQFCVDVANHLDLGAAESWLKAHTTPIGPLYPELAS